VRCGMCPFLHSGESDAMKSEMKERDTIPKPVGLGTLLQNHNTNSCGTGSNTIR
jgi:hypothetical protein